MSIISVDYGNIGGGGGFYQSFGVPTLGSGNTLTVPFDIRKVVMTSSGGGYYTIYWDYNDEDTDVYGQKLSRNATTWDAGNTRSNTAYGFSVSGKTITFTTTSFFNDITIITVYG